MSYGEGYRDGREDGYERAIRAVVAAQWAVACALFYDCFGTARVDAAMMSRIYDEDDVSPVLAEIAALPTAEQLVDGAG